MMAKKDSSLPRQLWSKIYVLGCMMICWLSLGGLNLHIYYYTDKSQKIQSFPESLEKKE